MGSRSGNRVPSCSGRFAFGCTRKKLLPPRRPRLDSPSALLLPTPSSMRRLTKRSVATWATTAARGIVLLAPDPTTTKTTTALLLLFGATKRIPPPGSYPMIWRPDKQRQLPIVISSLLDSWSWTFSVFCGIPSNIYDCFSRIAEVWTFSKSTINNRHVQIILNITLPKCMSRTSSSNGLRWKCGSHD